MKLSRPVITVIVFIGWVFIAGCGERGPKTVPVHGTVSFVGRERPKQIQIFFRPNKTEGGVVRPTIVKCDEGGEYQAKSFERSRGLIPGTYGVMVEYFDHISGKDPRLESSYKQGTFDAGELVVDPSSGGVEHNIEVPAQGAPAKKT
jgi:hypothetical protein